MKQVNSGHGSTAAWRLNNRLLACMATCLIILVSSGQAQTLHENAQMIDRLSELPVGLGALPEPRIPADNPQSVEKVKLGRRLFFDKVLSVDRSISCGTCHDPKTGLSDGRPCSLGFHGTVLRRHKDDDQGRFAVTAVETDCGAFKNPKPAQ